MSIAAVFNVAMGGAIGAVLRYLVGEGVRRTVGVYPWPISTLLINVLGCFLIGLVMFHGQQRHEVPVFIRNFWVLGVLGGFTTFSAFGLETVNLLINGERIAALLNVVLSVTLGVIAVWLGGSVQRLV